MPDLQTRRNVVVVGGGFAGAAFAKRIQKRLPDTHQVVLVNRDNYVTYNPLLPEVVGASIAPVHAVAPVRQIAPRAHHMMVRVSGIDRERRVVEYVGEGSGEIPYDHLVMACGNFARLDLVPGMERYALPLKTLGDALFLRNRVMARLEQADLAETESERRWLSRFVVIGAGFSGVEVAGEINDFLGSAARFYPSVRREELKVVVIHKGEQILPELPNRLGDTANRTMTRHGIDIRTRARVTEVTDQDVRYTDEHGELVTVSGGTIISTIGTTSNPLLGHTDLPLERGRLSCDPDMRVTGTDHVWAIGDCAAIPLKDGTYAPPTAQFADREGRQAADNLVRTIQGEATRPFRFKPLGALSTVGHNRAVAEILGLQASGVIGFLLWRGVYILKFPTFARKARIFLEWNWDLFFAQDIVQLQFNRTQRAEVRPRA